MQDHHQFIFNENMLRFGLFEPDPHVAVSVSGGSDSMTLLLLANFWAKTYGGKVTAITVNHNLRAEASLDCEHVKNYCDKGGIECYVLSWQHEKKICSNVMAHAREARYGLITKLCKELDILHLLTGHHRDDMVENFFLRLNRGTGLVGLSAQAVNFINDVRVLRPLYNFTKDDCVNYLSNYQVAWRHDDTNDNTYYLRNQLRSNFTKYFLLGDINSGQFKKRIADVQYHLTNAFSIVRQEFIKLLAVGSYISDLGYAILDLKEIRKANIELQYLMISYLTTIISGSSQTPRFKSVEQLWYNLQELSFKQSTLHGCVMTRNDGYCIIYRELSKISGEQVILAKSGLWDKRFRFIVDGDLNGHYSISSINVADYAKLKPYLNLSEITKVYQIANAYGRAILFTLPIVRYFAKVVAIPHLNYYESEFIKKLLNIKIIFSPNFVSRFIHFAM